MDRPGQTRNSSGPDHHPAMTSRRNTNPEGKNHQARHRRIRSHCGCPGCNAIKDRKRAQAHSDRCRMQIEEIPRIAPQGAEIIDRISEVINEALAEELQRDDRWKERDSRVTTAASAPQTPASASREMRERRRLSLTLNPKRRLCMKSGWSAASGRGQQHVQRSSTDVDAEAPTSPDGDRCRQKRSVMGRRRIAEKTSPVGMSIKSNWAASWSGQ